MNVQSALTPDDMMRSAHFLRDWQLGGIALLDLFR